jgi:hypothetical protein
MLGVLISEWVCLARRANLVSSYSFAYLLQVSPFFTAPCGSLLEGLGWKQAISNTSREGEKATLLIPRLPGQEDQAIQNAVRPCFMVL